MENFDPQANHTQKQWQKQFSVQQAVINLLQDENKELKNEKTARPKLLELVTDFVGWNKEEVENKTDLELIIIVLEELAEVSDKVKDHTHTIN